MTAVIDVLYTRKALGFPPGTAGYVNQIKIDPETAPDELEKCLVFLGRTVSESFSRVANLSDILNPAIDDAPPALNLFSSAAVNAALAGFQVGDVITLFQRPLGWDSAGVTPQKEYTVTAVVGTDAKIAETFPSYAESIEFLVTRGTSRHGLYYDGVATRDYNGVTATEFRVNEYATFSNTKTDAEAELALVKAGLQALADEYNLDYYEQDETETYTGDLGSSITIRYVTERIGTGTYEYYVWVAATSATSALQDCLVFRRELGSQRETLVRIATLDDLTDISSTPPDQTEFRSDYFLGLPEGTIKAGDEIHILPPVTPLWAKVLGPSSFTVGTTGIDPTIAPVTGIPVYENRHSFTVYRAPNTYPSSGNFTDGVTGRPVDTSVLYYRTNIYQTVLFSLSEAINLVDSLKGQAESLVTAYDFDDFSGTETGEYK